MHRFLTTGIREIKRKQKTNKFSDYYFNITYFLISRRFGRDPDLFPKERRGYILTFMWFLYAFLSAICAALVAILGKLGLKGVDSTLATTIRSLVMAGFLVVTSFFLNKFEGFTFTSIKSKDWILIVLAGIVGALSWLFYFFALKIGLATKVVAIDRLSIILVVLLSALFLGETFGWKTALGAVLMVGGAILISLK